MIGKIFIQGHIGPSYVDESGRLRKGVELLEVIEQIGSFPQATELEVSINSPGGYTDIGDAIYDYLLSQKKQGKKIITKQVGLIGSIATKIFLSGDERLVDDRFKFWIHNPYMDKVSGDQDQLRKLADEVEETEKGLIKLYSSFSSVASEGIDALMKVETGLTADQCVKFGFATGKVPSLVFNIIKEKMSDTKKGVQPKNSIPTNDTAKSLVVNLADEAGSFWVEGEVIAVGAVCKLLDEAGNPTEELLAQGDYTSDKGEMVTVDDKGVITAYTPAASEAEVVTKEAAETLVAEAVAKVKAEFEEKLDAVKRGVSLGIQPKKAVMSNKKDDEPVYETIAMRMARMSKERKQALINRK